MPRLRPDSYAVNTLSRYSGSKGHEFQNFVILTNFNAYLDTFQKMGDCVVHDEQWQVIHNKTLNISMVNFGIGSPMAAMVMHCLGYLDHVEAVLMLGLAGGLAEEMSVGDFVLPTASIRDEGSSDHYLQTDVPALPNFRVQTGVEKTAFDMGIQTRSGIFKTTDYRMWEFDADFAALLKKQRVVAIDMEISALFSVGYALSKPVGAVMLISDLPLLRTGIKRSDSTKTILRAFSETHLQLGLNTIDHLHKKKVFTNSGTLSYEW